MKIGDKVDPEKIVKGLPPVILQVQPTGYVPINKPEEIKAFEEMAHQLYRVRLAGVRGACETCSGGCTDDCGLLEA